MFCEAEQLLQREDNPSHAQLAELLQGSFSLLCDVKSAGGDEYFRLNDEKASPALPMFKADLTRVCSTSHPDDQHHPHAVVASISIKKMVLGMWKRPS